MATVIWLLYLADVAQGLSVVLGAGGVVALVICGSYYLISRDEYLGVDEPKSVRPIVIPALVAVSIAAILPSKTTIYAVAAVTAGDKALQTETGSKAVRALNAWLDKQIAHAGKEGGK